MRLLLFFLLLCLIQTSFAGHQPNEKSRFLARFNGLRSSTSTTPPPFEGYFLQDWEDAKREMNECIAVEEEANKLLKRDERVLYMREDLRAQIVCFYKEKHQEFRLVLNLQAVNMKEIRRMHESCGQSPINDFFYELIGPDRKAKSPDLSPSEKCGAAVELVVPFCQLQRECGTSRFFEAFAAYRYALNRYEANRSAGKADFCPLDWSPLGRQLNPWLYTDRFDPRNDEIFVGDVCGRGSNEKNANRAEQK
ncbi:hypothetical protein M3Y99_01183500 [Aphelenchoides fujianensis]|nr:hypothetical protein M3Y99_01183500 [Aphelenchoides fujianensis]